MQILELRSLMAIFGHLDSGQELLKRMSNNANDFRFYWRLVENEDQNTATDKKPWLCVLVRQRYYCLVIVRR
jgi:hypothetical protein